jgi:hypothetical protein
VGAGQRLGGGGGVGDSELVAAAAAGASASGELATFRCNFCKREDDHSASCCSAPGRRGSGAQRGGRIAGFPGREATASSSERTRLEGAPGPGRGGSEDWGAGGGGAGALLPLKLPRVPAGCALRAR